MIMEIVGDSTYLKKTQGRFDRNFTDQIVFFDLDDVFLGGFVYKSGQISGYVTEADGIVGKWKDLDEKRKTDEDASALIAVVFGPVQPPPNMQ